MKNSSWNALVAGGILLAGGVAFADTEPGPVCTGQPFTALRAARLVRGDSVRYPYSADYPYRGVRIASAQRAEWFRECISDGAVTECGAWSAYQPDGRYPLFMRHHQFSFYLGASAGVYDAGMYAESSSNTGYAISAKRLSLAEIQADFETRHNEVSYSSLRIAAPARMRVLSNCAKVWTSLKYDERDFGDGVKTWREHSLTLQASY